MTGSFNPCLTKQTMFMTFVQLPNILTIWHITEENSHWQMVATSSLNSVSGGRSPAEMLKMLVVSVACVVFACSSVIYIIIFTEVCVRSLAGEVPERRERKKNSKKMN